MADREATGGATGMTVLADAREVLLHLDKALRAHRLYDAGNELVLRFDDALRDQVLRFLRDHGELTLRVRPTAFELGGAPVDGPGLDELALALFRQGIVALRVLPTLTEHQLKSFVEILNHGLRRHDAHEDDLVTRLWRAELASIKYSAVLGYQEEGDGSLDLDADLVGETLTEALAIDLAELPERTRKAFEEKAFILRGDSGNLPPDVAGLVAQLENEPPAALLAHVLGILRAAPRLADAVDDLPPEDLGRILATLRRGLLGHGDLEGLAALATLAAELRADDVVDPRYGEQAARFLAEGVEEHALTQLLAALPGGAAAHAEPLGVVARTMLAGNLELIARLADREPSERGRQVLNRLLLEVVGANPDYLIARFRALDGRRAVEALAMLARLDLDAARMAVSVRLPAAPEATQTDLLEAVRTIPDLLDQRVRAALLRLASKGGPLAVHIFANIERHADQAAAATVWSWLESQDLSAWEPAALEGALRALLVAGHADKVLMLAEDILGRRALFGRRTLADLKLTVIRALLAGDVPEVDALLSQHAESRDKLVSRACREVLEQKEMERARGTRAGRSPRKEPPP